ncbi:MULTISPECIES: iron uptake system protein EfeO [Brevibacterium]|uniref:Iron uptake system component EfeO n=2 Tax=Brevibacterium antiquum TaxID=234835 RepID=A0A2H1HU44_9MICO|nr:MULTISPECIES: iron uptake system protein EfeO [Brevibacterium]SMX66439.1 iron uptake system component EfeO [Brevibacterium antiquum CNRZ 918]SMX90758.1 iron uptake system component EfeO [Brevibacterium antiquum]HCG56320.1 peptidase M75 family protein [Brevibacterium sp.]
MFTSSTSRSALAVVVLGGVLLLTACEPNQQPDEAITVSSTDDKCEVSAQEAPAGTLKFDVTNEGTKVTEFYLLGEDGLRIIGEVENIAPGLNRSLTVTAPEGSYFTACKPGMIGDGIRNDFTVTKSEGGTEAVAEDSKLAEQATTQYASYVKDQTEQLQSGTKKFAQAYSHGDDDKARRLYAEVRMHWERIEPVAESFGDLDPKLDLREADLEEGQEWTGWHLLEKDLWPPKDDYDALSDADRQKYSDLLVSDTKILYDRTRDMSFTPDQLSNGAKELLDEVATGKVTGEEEAWSHTDLWDFQANVDGARIAYEDLQPLLATRDKELDSTLETRFDDLQKLLDQHRDGDGFVLYTELSKDEIKELADSVNALSEPLSTLTDKVVG